MRETEITVEVLESVDTVKQLIKSKGFDIVEEYDLNDYYFSKYPLEELKKFSYADLIKNSFIVRDVVDDNPKVLLTYKDKVIDENNVVLSEEKIVSRLGILDNSLKVFEKAGLTRWSSLKQRIIVFKNTEMCFALQNVKDCGLFIEYEEDDNMKDLLEEEKIDLMRNNVKKLGLKLGEDYSCKKVYIKFLRDNKLEG